MQVLSGQLTKLYLAARSNISRQNTAALHDGVFSPRAVPARWQIGSSESFVTQLIQCSVADSAGVQVVGAGGVTCLATAGCQHLRWTTRCSQSLPTHTDKIGLVRSVANGLEFHICSAARAELCWANL